MIWYTPTTSMATELNCCTKPAKLVAEVDRTFSRDPTWARKRVDSSHLVCMEPSAPLNLDGFQSSKALDQQGVALRRGAQGGFGQFFHLVLHQQRIDDHRHRSGQRGQNHPW